MVLTVSPDSPGLPTRFPAVGKQSPVLSLDNGCSEGQNREETHSKTALDHPYSCPPASLDSPVLRLAHVWVLPHPARPPVPPRPQTGAKPSPDTNGAGPHTQKHSPRRGSCSILVFLLVGRPFVKSNRWIQSMLRVFAVGPIISQVPLGSQQAPLCPSGSSRFPGGLGGRRPCFSSYRKAEWVSWRVSSSFRPRLSMPMLVPGGTLLSAGSAVRVGVEQYRIKPTMMMAKDRM